MAAIGCPGPAVGFDNFDSLSSPEWRVHVYGTARDELVAWCQAHGVALVRFDWASEHEEAGLARDAVYLLRPDSYVALAEPSGDPERIIRYLADHGLRPGSATR